MLIVIANAAVAFAQAVFSVKEISKTKYIKAVKECSRYNVIPADTITDNEFVSLVLKESRNKFERLDSVTRQEIYTSSLQIPDEANLRFRKKPTRPKSWT